VIVLDASAAVELLLGTPVGTRVNARTLNDTLSAPHLIDLEIANVLRRRVSMRLLPASAAEQALETFGALGVVRFAHADLLPRVWQLRGQLTAYDACYVALAEAVDGPLLTLDARLAATRNHRATIELLA
jgi:predicted nucleic acid-binding protein